MQLQAVFLIGLLAAACASVQDSDPQLDDWQLGPSEWPQTCDAAAFDALAELSAESVEKLQATKFDDLILYHHGWGTGIRNRQGLWRGNSALIVSCLGKPGHPDDASMKIIERTWRKARDPAE